MAGWSLENYEGRIVCPHCGTTDCAGIATDKNGKPYYVCCYTNKRVSTKALILSAIKNGNEPRGKDKDHDRQ